MKSLILMQGAPGSGKSTVAKALQRQRLASGYVAEIFSADDFWYTEVEPDQPLKYSFDPTIQGLNHLWNQSRVQEAMEQAVETVIVDNTNTQRWDAVPYLKLANRYGYSVQVVRVDPGVEECVARQANRTEDRRVPEDVIRKMYARMENLLG